MASFAGACGCAKSGFQRVGVGGFGGRGELDGLCDQLFAQLFELGLFSPDFWFCVGWGAAFVSAGAESSKRPLRVAIVNTGFVAKAWGDVQLTPTTYLVNKRGEIVKRYVGEPDFADLDRLIKRLREQKA